LNVQHSVEEEVQQQVLDNLQPGLACLEALLQVFTDFSCYHCYAKATLTAAVLRHSVWRYNLWFVVSVWLWDIATFLCEIATFVHASSFNSLDEVDCPELSITSVIWENNNLWRTGQCYFNNALVYGILPSVLWRCWLGGRKGTRPVKNWALGCWRGYLSGARYRLAYGPADATASHCLLLQ